MCSELILWASRWSHPSAVVEPLGSPEHPGLVCVPLLLMFWTIEKQWAFQPESSGGLIAPQGSSHPDLYGNSPAVSPPLAAPKGSQSIGQSVVQSVPGITEHGLRGPTLCRKRTRVALDRAAGWLSAIEALSVCTCCSPGTCAYVWCVFRRKNLQASYLQLASIEEFE